jgi:UDP-N-acetylmuramate--alanine ligase
MFRPRKETVVHFVGIGGIGMSGIAEILLKMGFSVQGSDVSESYTTSNLVLLGAKIFYGHRAENIEGATLLVHSTAINKQNPELVAAKENNIPVMRRAEMLAELMRLKKGIAIAGTHGKTTTTSMLATILQESEFDPTYIIGGIVKNLKGHARVGKGEFLVAEADESDGTFLLLTPVVSLITNIDDDHLDHYGSEENLIAAFTEFANKIPFYGACFLCFENERVRELSKLLKKPWVSYGMEGSGASYEARNLAPKGVGISFDLYHEGKLQTHVDLEITGKHNVTNAVGAMAIAHYLGLEIERVAKAIGKFEGVGRRMQLLFSDKKLEIIDDYAHHPTEVEATLAAIKLSRPDKKLVVVFEPHRFTRTQLCWEKFLTAFQLADELYLLPIYPASEQPIEGIDSQNLKKDIMARGLVSHVETVQSTDFPHLVEKFKSSNCVLTTMGAGSIGKIVRNYVE